MAEHVMQAQDGVRWRWVPPRRLLAQCWSCGSSAVRSRGVCDKCGSVGIWFTRKAIRDWYGASTPIPVKDDVAGARPIWFVLCGEEMFAVTASSARAFLVVQRLTRTGEGYRFPLDGKSRLRVHRALPIHSQLRGHGRVPWSPEPVPHAFDIVRGHARLHPGATPSRAVWRRAALHHPQPR